MARGPIGSFLSAILPLFLCGKGSAILPFLDLPVELQRRIVESVPLRKLAQLACLCKELRALYMERVHERNIVVAALLESQFTAEFREGLSPANTALPRDLVVEPQMDPRLLANPDRYPAVESQCGRGQYRGFCVAGEPDGRGGWRSNGGNRYVGDWRGGHWHGWGTQTWADGTRYVGEWVSGCRHGQGTLVFASGGTYEGDWQRGYRHGNGMCEWPTGEVYVGKFVNDVMHGLGAETLSDGAFYFGEFKSGKRHGEGMLTYPDGSKYVGVWLSDMTVQGGHA